MLTATVLIANKLAGESKFRTEIRNNIEANRKAIRILRRAVRQQNQMMKERADLVEAQKIRNEGFDNQIREIRELIKSKDADT